VLYFSGDMSVSLPEAISCSVDLQGNEVDTGEVIVHDIQVATENNLQSLTGKSRQAFIMYWGT